MEKVYVYKIEQNQNKMDVKWTSFLNHYSTCYMHIFTHSIVYVSYAFGHFHVNNKHAHTHTNAHGCIKSSLGFSILPKDPSTYRLDESG